MRVPDLEELVRDQERAIRRQEQGTDLLHEWDTVLVWLQTLDDMMPIFEDWVTAAFGLATTSPDKIATMWSMLDAAYPKKALKDSWGERHYDYRRLRSVLRKFRDLAGRPV